MKRTQSKLTLLVMLALGLALGLTTQSYASGTAAGTDIENTASVTYELGGEEQPPETDDDTFEVDRLIDLDVTWQDATNVLGVPNATDKYLTFLVTNQSNDTLDFYLSLEDVASDDFDVTSVAVYVDTNGNGTYDSGTDTEITLGDTTTDIDNLAADGSVEVYVFGTIPSDAAQGETDSHVLQATALDADGTALSEDADGDDPTLVEDVFGDAAGDFTADVAEDGDHSDTGTFEVPSVTIAVQKSSAVISDPINGTTNPLAIPGAIVRYTIMVTCTDAAGVGVTNVTVTDSLATEITAGTLAYKAGTILYFENGEVPGVDSGTTLTDVATDSNETDTTVEGDWNGTATNTVTASGISMGDGGVVYLTFDVEITPSTAL